jgi:hypothetical protein
VSERAYRFIPLDADGKPRENSYYQHTSSRELRAGDVIEGPHIRGFTRWEVIDVRSETRPLLEARDASGAQIPLAGTLICRGLRNRQPER